MCFVLAPFLAEAQMHFLWAGEYSVKQERRILVTLIFYRYFVSHAEVMCVPPLVMLLMDLSMPTGFHMFLVLALS